MPSKKENRENNGNAANNSEKLRLRQNSRITRVDLVYFYINGTDRTARSDNPSQVSQ